MKLPEPGASGPSLPRLSRRPFLGSPEWVSCRLTISAARTNVMPGTRCSCGATGGSSHRAPFRNSRGRGHDDRGTLVSSGFPSRWSLGGAPRSSGEVRSEP